MSGATDVNIKGVGINDSVEAQVDPTNRALRISFRPPEIGVGGSYSAAFQSGVMAAGLAAGSPIFVFRWTSVSMIALIRRLRLTADTDGTAFAQGSTIFDLIRATNFLAQDSGGATITFGGKTGARATRMPPSQIQISASAVGNIAVANTATLAAGTRSLDNVPLHVLVGGAGANPAIGLVPPPGYLVDPTEAARQPLELWQNEGLVLRATVPATGTWKFGVEVDWDEVDPARYFGLFS